jgi:hypothetical protein
MAGHTCHHCKQWVEKGEEHDCWTTTEEALTRHLPEDLRDAWERLRETAAEFGEQRIYASHKSIMFARKVCYFFVRPRTKDLQVCIFLGRMVKAPQVYEAKQSSKSKVYHLLRITHRDQVESPITDWLREAYEFCGATTTAAEEAPPKSEAKRASTKTKKKPAANKASKKKAVKTTSKKKL